MAECLFCEMAQGRAPVDKLYDDELVFVIRDIHPAAPVHLLVISKEHIPSASYVQSEHGALLARMFAAAAEGAKQEGLRERGYRLVINAGPDAGMTIEHLHMHCLGGRPLGREG